MVEVNEKTKKLLMSIGTQIGVTDALLLCAALEALKHVKNNNKVVWFKCEELYGSWLNNLFTHEEGNK